jgi:hypothetical protein
MECNVCSKSFKTESGFKSHTKKSCDKHINKCRNKNCPKCGFKIANKIESHINICDGSGPRRLKKRREGGHQWAKGKTYEELFGKEKAQERIEELKLNYKENPIIIDDDVEQERRNKIRIKIIERYANGWESTAGRCKKISYFSNVAGNIKVDGTWELSVAKYLDSLGVNWIRNKKRFKYFNSIKNRTSTYCPDFYVEEWGCFIEVKGYKTELDDIKWANFKDKLEIWDKDKLTSLGIDIRYKKKRV